MASLKNPSMVTSRPPEASFTVRHSMVWNGLIGVMICAGQLRGLFLRNLLRNLLLCAGHLRLHALALLLISQLLLNTPCAIEV